MKSDIRTIKIKKGIDLPIAGKPIPQVFDGPTVNRVALVGPDYAGLKPRFEVAAGDKVRTGQKLFYDKKNPDVIFTSPGTGDIIEINRGEKRRFLSIIIGLDEEDPIQFKVHSDSEIRSLKRDDIVSQLVESGLWTSIRQRPFDKIPNPATVPDAIFITAMDTHPLAPKVPLQLLGRETDFAAGVQLLSNLTEGPVYLCKAQDEELPEIDLDSVQTVIFEGPHPSGNTGTHMHFLQPVLADSKVWHMHAEDVAAIGELFRTGLLPTQKVIALAGPSLKNPRHIKTWTGACISDLLRNETKSGSHRSISGSVLNGHTASDAMNFLGKYHHQISVIEERIQRDFIGWLSPGFNLFSIKNIVASKIIRKKSFNMTTEMYGGHRSIVPSGSYESVLPFDMEPTYLLRALAAGDIDESIQLGALELAEEDLALCSFVCPSKTDHGINLRQMLTMIEKEGF